MQKDTEHPLLLCPSFGSQGRVLLTGIAELLRPFVQIANLLNDALTQLLLYGNGDLPYKVNRGVVVWTLCFICETGQFD